MIGLEKYFKILNVEIGASKEKIKKAYHKLAHQHHPDKGGDEAKMKEINEAYAILMNPSKVIRQPAVQPQYQWYYYTSYGQATQGYNGSGTASFY